MRLVRFGKHGKMVKKIIVVTYYHMEARNAERCWQTEAG